MTQPQRKRVAPADPKRYSGRPPPCLRRAEAVRAAPARRKGADRRRRSVRRRRSRRSPDGSAILRRSSQGGTCRKQRRRASWLPTLGRSGRPILIGPWLSEAGFELLYWIPFLAWAKVYGNLDPSQLVVISRGGAASWYRDITTNYEDVLSFLFAGGIPRAQRRTHRRTARPPEARRDLELRPRDHREGHREARPQRRPPAAPLDDVPAVRSFLVPAGAGDAHRGLYVVRAAAAG